MYFCLPGDSDTLLDKTQRNNADGGKLDHGAGESKRRRAHAEEHTAQPHGAQGKAYTKNITKAVFL